MQCSITWIVFLGGGQSTEYLAKFYSYKLGDTQFTKLQSMYIERRNFAMQRVQLNGKARIASNVFFYTEE